MCEPEITESPAKTSDRVSPITRSSQMAVTFSIRSVLALGTLFLVLFLNAAAVYAQPATTAAGKIAAVNGIEM